MRALPRQVPASGPEVWRISAAQARSRASGASGDPPGVQLFLCKFCCILVCQVRASEFTR